MDFFLSKLLPPLIYPLGISLGLVALAVIATGAGRRRLAMGAGSLAVGVLWLASTPWFAATLTESLQRGYDEISAAALPSADAIVVIGGIMAAAHSLESTNVGGAVDRLLFAKRLFEAGKAPYLLVAGGADAGWVPEADLMAELLMEWGVPRTAILRETTSRNTRQNALGVKAVLERMGLRSALLVTSAVHIKRAEATFGAAGVNAIAAPTDFMASHGEFHILGWLPDAGALAVTTLCLKEYLGLLVYRWRGWTL